MASIVISGYSVSSEVVTLLTDSAHGLSSGQYISVRDVATNINGQYYIDSVPSAISLTFEKTGIGDVSVTSVEGYILYTEFNTTGKPAYIYDNTGDAWYQISAKVNTSGNYSWTGTHLHEVPVTMNDVLVMNNLSASPSASPSGGGYLYVEDGELKFKGGSGTITTIAPA